MAACRLSQQLQYLLMKHSIVLHYFTKTTVKVRHHKYQVTSAANTPFVAQNDQLVSLGMFRDILSALVYCLNQLVIVVIPTILHIHQCGHASEVENN